MNPLLSYWKEDSDSMGNAGTNRGTYLHFTFSHSLFLVHYTEETVQLPPASFGLTLPAAWTPFCRHVTTELLRLSRGGNIFGILTQIMTLAYFFFLQISISIYSPLLQVFMYVPVITSMNINNVNHSTNPCWKYMVY